jgi:hypothetical protein
MSRVKYLVLTVLAPLLMLVAAPYQALAFNGLFPKSVCDQVQNDPTCKVGNDGSVENPAVHIVQVATSIVALLAGFLAVFMIMISGFQYVTSGGSDEAVSNAKKRLRSALIGLVVVALAWTIIRFVTDSLLS